jgi:hypothetical protein
MTLRRSNWVLWRLRGTLASSGSAWFNLAAWGVRVAVQESAPDCVCCLADRVAPALVAEWRAGRFPFDGQAGNAFHNGAAGRIGSRRPNARN